MASSYGFEGPRAGLGRPLRPDGTPLVDVEVGLPLGLLNRHGLICGATGTGKTKTLQLLAERISAAGSPVFAADVKGDVAGLGAAGAPDPRIDERAAALGQEWRAEAAPVELLSLTGAAGVSVRASVASFGPTLLGKVLSLNDTQESSLGLVFHYCDRRGLPLIELEDLRAALAWLSGPGKPELAELGGLSPATVGVLVRKVTELEAAGGDVFFGEPELDVGDLLRTADDGRGIVSVLDVSDLGRQPRIFSTFLMWVLAELFEELPEVGDPERPELVFFLDEAHLLFEDATATFLEAVAQTVRLIRSKGVAVFFVTQLPTDLPDEVLAQLGHRVQHAVRAHTPRDARALAAIVDTFPTTEHYDLGELLTSLGVGEAAVTALDLRGVPTPVAPTRLYAPASRMGPLTPEEREALVAASPLRARYADRVDRESAEEMLAARRAGDPARAREVRERAPRAPAPSRRRAPRSDKGLTEQVGKILTSREGQRLAREVVRGLFGVLRRR